MYEAVAFYLFAILTIFFFSVTVFSKNALFSMSSLAAGMIFIAGFFFLLDAEFLGVVQIVVYTGAVMALYAFGMMFFDTTKDVKERVAYKRVIYTLSFICAILIVLILIAPLYSVNIAPVLPMSSDFDNTQMLGRVLFTKYLVAFELTAVMLLVAMVAGIVLASKKINQDFEIAQDGGK
ncbi:MAG: NADH-quinone oxidoreductase subunit J [Campylobacteraceae bacterium]